MLNTFCAKLTKRTTAIYKNKKSGNLTQNEMDSALVVLTLLSSNFGNKTNNRVNKQKLVVQQ
jgi:hypothetical protein